MSEGESAAEAEDETERSEAIKGYKNAGKSRGMEAAAFSLGMSLRGFRCIAVLSLYTKLGNAIPVKEEYI